MRKARYPALIVLVYFTMVLFSGCGKNTRPEALQPPEMVQWDPGLYPASTNIIQGDLWGYVDKKGEFVIKPIFEEAGDFQSNGLAIARTGGKAGIIDTRGKYIVEPKYDSVSEYSDGLAIAAGPQGYEVLDEKGNVVFKAKRFISNYHEGRASFVNSDDQGKWLYGYVDREGRVIVEPKFESASDFVEGKAVVGFEGGGFGLIEKEGKLLKSFDYAFAGSLGDGLMLFQKTNEGKYGYADEKGNVVIKPQFGSAEAFSGDRAVVSASGQMYNSTYGLIDKQGNYIIKPYYANIRNLKEGIFAIGIPINKEFPERASIYAVADRDGKTLTDFSYYGVSGYSNGLASAYDNSSTFFIDKTGRRAENLPTIKGIGTLTLEGDVIKAFVDSRVSYYDKDGNVIWKPNSDIALNNEYVVRGVKYRPNRNYLVYYPQIEGMENQGVKTAVNNRLKEMAVTEKVNSNDELDYSYQGDFKIKFFHKNLLELELSGYSYPFGAAHGMPALAYAPVDLKTGKFYDLKELFKKDSNYVQKLSDIVKKQIAENKVEGVWPDSYKGIQPDQPFFVTKDALNLYFLPYEIAPYAAGFPTFTIPFKEITDIIETQGAFWKSLN